MKKLFFAVSIFILTAAGAFAQPKTVTDYFLAMPADMYATSITGDKYKSKAELTEFRRSLIQVEDVKNGYLKLEGPWEGWAEIALFKKADGGYLIAESNVGCGPECGGDLKLFTYVNGKWTNVTKMYAPKVTEKMVFDGYRKRGGKDPEITKPGDVGYYFKLPREGRTMKLACNMCDDGTEDFVVLEYDWNGKSFVKK